MMTTGQYDNQKYNSNRPLLQRIIQAKEHVHCSLAGSVLMLGLSHSSTHLLTACTPYFSFNYVNLL